MACNYAQIVTLWNNNGMSQVRQSNSNKNEQCHSFKKLMNPRLFSIGHQFWELYRNLFIWKHNYNAIRYIINHRDKFTIDCPNWLNSLLDLFDQFYSFELSLDIKVPFQHIYFDPNYVVNSQILTYEKCVKAGYIKANDKKLKWSRKDDKLLCNWIAANARPSINTQELFQKCLKQPEFAAFDERIL